MQTTVVYRFDEEDESLYEAIKISAKTVTIRGVGTQARLAKQAAAQWRAELPPAESAAGSTPTADPATETDPEQTVKYNAYVRWATCAAGTHSLAVVKRNQQSKELDPDAIDAWQWETSSLAALGWDQPQGVLDIKTDLFDAWEKAVQAANPGIFGRALTSGAKKDGSDRHDLDQRDLIDDFLLALLRPSKAETGFITLDELEQAERERVPLCDEANLQVFALWYEFGGLKRPLTPVEAAEMPADLARDFIHLLKRMRQLADSEIALSEWVNSNIFKHVEQREALYPQQHPWE